MHDIKYVYFLANSYRNIGAGNNVEYVHRNDSLDDSFVQYNLSAHDLVADYTFMKHTHTKMNVYT